MAISDGVDIRFEFGANWSRFLRLLDDQRIERAKESLVKMLGEADLRGKRFLDIGSGSGLFSLAARQLGATVHSFDYDQRSVDCTSELRRRYFVDDVHWRVERGSALDEDYLRALGQFDIVYSWGVLHHTGNMWQAFELATIPLGPAGKFYISIYNRLTPLRHRLVSRMKRAYVHGPAPLRWALVGGYAAYAGSFEVLAAVLHGRPPLARIREYSTTSRGMSWWTDVVDWVGGLPYESARPEEVVDFFHARGLHLSHITTQDGHGCNEFVFTRSALELSR